MGLLDWFRNYQATRRFRSEVSRRLRPFYCSTQAPPAEPFYGLTLIERLPILGSAGSLEAWRASDGTSVFTLVRSRPDIIQAHLDGNLYCSNVDSLRKDLLLMQGADQAEHELRLVELRLEEEQRLVFGLFEPFLGIPIRSVVDRVTTQKVSCAESVVASIALIILRSYAGRSNTIGSHGTLIRCELPSFEHVLAGEFPSFTGAEPEAFDHAKLREALELTTALLGANRPSKELIGFWEFCVQKREFRFALPDEVAAYILEACRLLERLADDTAMIEFAMSF